MGTRRGSGRAAVRGLALVALVILSSLTLPERAAPPASAPVGPMTLSASSTTPALAPEPDLARLQAELDDADRRASAAGNAAMAAAGRAVGAGIAVQQASLQVDQARGQLRDDVRRTLTDTPAETLPSWVFDPDPASVGLLREMRERQVARRADALAAMRSATAALDAAHHDQDAQRAAAVRSAGDAVLAADHARRLLDQAEKVHAANAAIRARLEAQRRALDELNKRLVRTIAPIRPTRNDANGNPVGPLPTSATTLPDGTRPDASAATQAAILKVLEGNPPDRLPPGYRPTGQVLDGTASWYGPGFIGSPTSSGVPYDPERLTCAMLAVPLGTVIRVTKPDGASVNLLVNDHGPYVGDRILDVSMRANRILNLGMGPVHIEVLAPTG